MAAPTDKSSIGKGRNSESLAKWTVRDGVTFLTVTSPVDPKKGEARRTYRVHVVAPARSEGGIAAMADALLERFGASLEQAFVKDFVRAFGASDEKARRQHLGDLSKMLQWDPNGRPPSQDPPRLPGDLVSFQALGIWNAQAWFDEKGRLGRWPRLLVLIKTLCAAAGSDEALAAMIAHALGEGTEKAEATWAMNQVRRELRQVRSKRDGSGLDLIAPALLAAFNGLQIRERLPLLDFSDLVEVDLGAATGRRALVAFEAWVKTGFSMPRDDLRWRRRRSTPDATIDERTISRFARALIAEVTEADCSYTMMQWPSGAQPATGIAVASACIDELKRTTQDWRVIWLCASRPSESFRRVSAREFLRPLAQAFAVTLPSDGVHGPAQELGAVIDVLRMGLSRHKCLVVVEGLRNAGGRIGPLLDFISGVSTFEAIVRGLATPPTPDACQASGSGFAASRFLLLPARAVRGILDLSTGGVRNSELAVAASELATACRSVPDEASKSAASMLERLRSRDQAEQAPVLADPPGVGVEALIDELAHRHAASLVVLALVGSVPDGTLLGTLRRIFLQWRRLVERVVRQPLARDAGDLLDDVERQIAELARCVADVRHGRRDPKEWLAGSTLDDYMGKLVYVELQEIHEHLGEQHLRWEVEKEIDPWKPGAGVLDDQVAWGRFKPMLAFKSPAARDLLIEAICRKRPKANEGLNGYVLSRLGWRLMQFAAAGECLRQGTALLRNARPKASVELETRRRLIQAQHHILAAGDLSGVGLGDDRSEELDHQDLLYPADAYRRRSFVYSGLYRQLIEHEEWWLTRAWGRSEMRVGLLLQALYPGWHARGTQTARPRTAMECEADDTSDESLRALDQLVVAANKKRADASAQLQAHELRLQRAFFRSLLHAASDAEDHELAKRCLHLTKSLSAETNKKPTGPGRRPSVSQSATQSDTIATAKLEFDVLDARSADRTSEAQDICLTALSDVKIEPRWIFEVTRVGKRLAADVPSGLDPRMALASLKELRDGWVNEPSIKSGGVLGFVADMVARWADVLSNKADQIEDRRLEAAANATSQVPDERIRLSQLDQEVEEFFIAWTAFWLANALRAEVGMQLEGHGQRYGKVTARPYRTGIRTTLKLARLLALQQARGGMTAERREPTLAVRWFLEYARSRADILARDVHLYERERIQTVLIQASIARTTANIDRDLNGHLICHPSELAALKDALLYVSGAERRLLDLGSPRPVARRWIVERLNVLGLWLLLAAAGRARAKNASGDSPEAATLQGKAPALVQSTTADMPEIAHLAAALVHDLNTLARLADGSPFWRSLHRRAILRYARLRSSFALDGFAWPQPAL